MPTPLTVLWSLFAVIALSSGPAAATMPDAILSDAPSLEERAVAEGRSIQVARKGLSFGSARRTTTTSTSPTPPATSPRAPLDPQPARSAAPAPVQPNHALPSTGTGIAVGIALSRSMRSEETNAAAEAPRSGSKELLLSALLGVCVFSIVLLFTPLARVFGEPDESEPVRSTGPAREVPPGRSGAAVASAARAGFGRR